HLPFFHASVVNRGIAIPRANARNDTDGQMTPTRLVSTGQSHRNRVTFTRLRRRIRSGEEASKKLRRSFENPSPRTPVANRGDAMVRGAARGGPPHRIACLS